MTTRLVARRCQTGSIDRVANVTEAPSRQGRLPVVSIESKAAHTPGKPQTRRKKPAGYPCNERLPALKQTPCIRDGQLITLRFQLFSCANTLCQRAQPLFAEVWTTTPLDFARFAGQSRALMDGRFQIAQHGHYSVSICDAVGAVAAPLPWEGDLEWHMITRRL